MHREISHTDQAFSKESNLSLYLLTGLLGLIIGIDLWPTLAGWLKTWGIILPYWQQDIAGYRIALLAAVLGGARDKRLILTGMTRAESNGRCGGASFRENWLCRT